MMIARGWWFLGCVVGAVGLFFSVLAFLTYMADPHGQEKADRALFLAGSFMALVFWCMGPLAYGAFS